MRSFHLRTSDARLGATALLLALTLTGVQAAPAEERPAPTPQSEQERERRNVLASRVPSISRATPAACNQPTSEERVKCKLDNAMTQAEDTAAMIMLMDDVPMNHKHALMEETRRARRSEGRSTMDDFKQMMKKKPKCQVVELDEGPGANDGDNDGVCTGNEICAEVAGDGVGNDDGVCSPRNGKNREICAEICDEEGLAVEDNLDPAMGQELEDDLDRTTRNFMELNDQLEQDMTLHEEMKQLAQSNDPCAAVMTAGMNRPIGVEERKPNALLGAALVVRDVQALQADIADKACSIDGAGFNVKVVCAVFEGIRAIAILVATVQEIKRDNITSDTIEISFECIKKLDQEVGETTAQLDAIQGQVRTLEQQLSSAQNEVTEVIDLIKLPPGRRPGYSKKGGGGS